MTYIVLLLAHYLLDFPLQGDYLAKTKATEPYSMLAHVAIYSLGITVAVYVLRPDLVGIKIFAVLAYVAVLHLMVDQWKSHQSVPKKWHIWFDQALHLLVISFLALWIEVAK